MYQNRPILTAREIKTFIKTNLNIIKKKMSIYALLKKNFTTTEQGKKMVK